MYSAKAPLDTKQEILHLLLKQGQMSAQGLAEALQISPQATRRHLQELENEGLVSYTPVVVGMGRPQHLYHLTKQGRDRFPAGYDQFTVSFLDTLTESLGKEQVQQVLAKQWQKKAEAYRAQIGTGTLAEKIQKLAELRQAEGYITDWSIVPETGDLLYTEYNCAIATVAESFPAVCSHELEMFSAIFDVPVERTHWLVDGQHRCGYLIKSSPVKGRTGSTVNK
ncbi:MAG: iron-sulfur cluster biosynthesis transcriptional regulator SufR [Pseudanabaenaceae cyanobacterium]